MGTCGRYEKGGFGVLRVPCVKVDRALVVRASGMRAVIHQAMLYHCMYILTLHSPFPSVGHAILKLLMQSDTAYKIRSPSRSSSSSQPPFH